MRQRFGWTLAVCLIAWTSACDQKVTPSTPVHTQIRTALEAGKQKIVLSDLQGMPVWKRAFIFGPYTSTDTIVKKLGHPWSDANTFRLDLRDDINLAVFSNGAEVVRVEEWRRDFDCDRAILSRPLKPKTILVFNRHTQPPRLEVSNNLLDNSNHKQF